jgi:D-3-phosphoglycerate dehydrogenase
MQQRVTVVLEDAVYHFPSNKVRELLKEIENLAQVKVMDPFAPEEEWVSALRDAVAVVNRKGRLSAKMISSSKLRLIARTGVGVDDTRVDLQEAKRRGIVITYNPGANSSSVAELTVLLMLSVFRRLNEVTKAVREGRWTQGVNVLGQELSGKTLGLVGVGNVGRRVATIAKAMGMEVIGYDPYVREVEGIRLMSLEEVLRSSDVVSLHVPLTAETRRLLNAQKFSLMKDGSVLINTSRGEVVDEEALISALRTGKLMGAGLDVLSVEPPKQDNPLLRMDNVIITPHVGGGTREALERGIVGALEEVMRFLRGEQLKNVFKY